MDQFRFRPRLTDLEDRTTPDASPADVFAAISQTTTAQTTLVGLFQHLHEPMNVLEPPFWKTYLPTLAAQNQQAAGVLAEFLANIQGQIAANPASAGALSQLAGGIGALEYTAVMNAGYADVYAVGFGAVLTPPSPPTPPPVTPPPPSGIDPTLTGAAPDVSGSDVTTLADGLRIRDVVTGTGDPVVAGGSIVANYTGWLTDGTKFDSSVDRGQPLKTPLDGVIQGWQEGIPGMKPGGVRELFIPAALAYGNNPPPGSSIPANADLIFAIQLVSTTPPSSSSTTG